MSCDDVDDDDDDGDDDDDEMMLVSMMSALSSRYGSITVTINDDGSASDIDVKVLRFCASLTKWRTGCLLRYMGIEAFGLRPSHPLYAMLCYAMLCYVIAFYNNW